ncbi:hypothetical protein, partial [Longimicrobium sp.]|uniref:hypothetical protein n=1 Tax=Longimicrobium sp. TaxID=2029185 RepID=UPI002F936B88
QAVGAYLVETVVPQVGRRNRLEVRPPSTAFDSAVALVLQAAPEAALPPRRGYYNWIATRRLAFHGDTAVVLVEQGTGWPAPADDPYALTFYVDQNHFFFVREPAGWRYVRRKFHSHADGGAVRG